MSLIPHVEPALVADIAIGLRTPERVLTEVMGRARGMVMQELHTFSSEPAWHALDDALDRGAHIRLLVNPRYVSPRHIPGGGFGLHLQEYAGETLVGGGAYQHSKLLASTVGLAGRPEAVFTNVSLMPDSASRPDVAVRMLGRSADVVREYLDASLGHDLTRLGQAADDARAGGLLVNEPLTGRSHLADGMRAMVDGAQRRIVIVSKGLDDADLAARLVQARSRGVEVSLSLRDLSAEQARVLEAGGVRVVLHPTEGPANRINAIVADDEVLLSTAYQWKAMLLQGTPTSRESGVLLGGMDAERAISMLERTPLGGVVLGAQPAATPAALPHGFQSLMDAMRGQRLVAELH